MESTSSRCSRGGRAPRRGRPRLHPACTWWALPTIERMRFPVVLFDLDGTLIDSGGMILASFRHATRTILRREIPDEQLVASVGGKTLHDQMRTLDPDRVDELVLSYREHNEPLHAELECCDGIVPVLEQLRAERRRLGVVTAKRHLTIQLAFDRLGIGEDFH